MGIHQCPLIVRSCKWLDINTSIRTSQDVLTYLGTHWHQWWVCLALVNDIHQWLVIQWLIFMLDINTFIRMTIIVPSGFIGGEDYAFPFASAVTTTWFLFETTTIPLSAFYIFHDSTIVVLIPSLPMSSIGSSIFHDLAAVTYSMLQHQHQPYSYCIVHHYSWVTGGMLFSNL